MSDLKQEYVLPKVFGIGLSRTGTSSLSRALEILGWKTVHFPKIEFELCTAQYQLPMLERVDALTDTPIAGIFPHLDLRYPGSRFILTVRDKEEWLSSCEEYFRIKDAVEIGGRLHNENVFHRLHTYGCVGFDRERFSYVYDSHEFLVKKYFAERPTDLLVLDVCSGNGWDELCAFLDVPKPDIAFPKDNSLARFRAKRLNGRECRDGATAPMCVATVTDQTFFPGTELLLWSFFQHNPNYSGEILVISDELTDAHQQRLSWVPNIRFVRPSAEVDERIGAVVERFPSLQPVLRRFFILEAFREQSQRLVLLDSDLHCRGPLDRLFLDEGRILCCGDSCHYEAMSRDSKTYRRVKRDHQLVYGRRMDRSFNSGVMSVDGQRTGPRIYKQLLDALDVSSWNGVEVPRLADQIVLNRVFENSTEFISPIYNYVVFLEAEIEATDDVLASDAKLIHFAGVAKPWAIESLADATYEIPSTAKFFEAWLRDYGKYWAWLPEFCKFALNSGEPIVAEWSSVVRRKRSRFGSMRTSRKLEEEIIVDRREFKRRRKECGISAKRLAHKLGVEESCIRAIEAGDEALPDELARRALRVLRKFPILSNDLDHDWPDPPNDRKKETRACR